MAETELLIPINESKVYRRSIYTNLVIPSILMTIFGLILFQRVIVNQTLNTLSFTSYGGLLIPLRGKIFDGPYSITGNMTACLGSYNCEVGFCEISDREDVSIVGFYKNVRVPCKYTLLDVLHEVFSPVNEPTVLTISLGGIALIIYLISYILGIMTLCCHQRLGTKVSFTGWLYAIFRLVGVLAFSLNLWETTIINMLPPLLIGFEWTEMVIVFLAYLLEMIVFTQDSN